MIFKYSLSLLLFTLGTIFCLDDRDPQQIHLSLGRDQREMVVTWTTYHSIDDASIVQYRPLKTINKSHTNDDEESEHEEEWIESIGQCTLFVDGGDLKRKHFIHRALLSSLEPLTRYEYRCGGTDSKWSAIKTFRTISNRTDWNPRIVLYGDLGLFNGVSIPRLRDEIEQDQVDLILHVGDFAYDMDTNNSYVGDEFMRTMEPIASRVPYQATPGNHENAYNFSNYVNRFSMFDMNDEHMNVVGNNNNHDWQKSINNHFYSFHVGPALFISFSTEFYYYVNYGMAQIYHQYEWLERVLIEANRPENRAKHPWIITLGHRPMYCSDADGDDCTFHNSLIRTGIPVLHTFALEPLFYKYGVDLELWAHEHSYERLWPLYDFNVRNGSNQEPYTNPTAPVHIITGSAGCQEFLDHFLPKPEWSAFRLSDYGYTRLQIHNGTHLTLEQVSDLQNGTIVDTIDLIQERHGVRTL